MLLTEEQINILKGKGIKVPYVNDTCIGCSACVAISPDVFTLNEEGKSVVLSRDSYEGLSVEDSIMACPVDCISWVE
ncbi:MAG: ferredoxin [Candidatus Gracilibacteria bacterium]|nr:ferredoxin [Candidatus Gracilibacteria bacterium]